MGDWQVSFIDPAKAIIAQIGQFMVNLLAVLLILIIGWGAYSQLVFGNVMIEDKKNSYYQMKEAFLWVKNNAPPGTVVLGEDVDLYTIYYANMNPQTWPQDSLEGYNITADYVVVNIYHGNSDRVQEYLAKIQANLELKKAFFFDIEQQQPTVLIYKYNK